MTRKRRNLIICFLLAGLGCKGVDDWLNDLNTVQPQAGAGANIFDQPQVVFDAGQLVHEALVGLASAEEMQPFQALKALYHGSIARDPLLFKNDALLRADGAVLIGRMATRIPVPPLDRPLTITENPETTAVDLVTKIQEFRQPLAIESEIYELSSPDEIRKQAARDALKKVPDIQFATPDEWEKWWEGGERARRLSTFVEQTREARAQLGEIKFKNSSQARAVLNYLATWLSLYGGAEVTNEMWPVVMRIARQVVVYSLNESIGDPSALVRGDVAEAMAMVRDPSFGDSLARQLQRDREPISAVRIISALGFYPSRRTILVLTFALQYEDQKITEMAASVLKNITGEDFGSNYDAWSAWWADKGTKSWP